MAERMATDALRETVARALFESQFGYRAGGWEVEKGRPKHKLGVASQFFAEADAALAALGLDDLDAAVERVAAVISYGYPHLHAEDNEGVRRTARDAIAALTATEDRDA